MRTDIISYAPYHPHLDYTLAITCIARVAVAMCSRFGLSHRPKQCIALNAQGIGLPIYAEVTSALSYLLPPALHTPTGYVLSHFHIFVQQRLPLDSFLQSPTEEAALGVLALITLASLARVGEGRRRVVLARHLERAAGRRPLRLGACEFALACRAEVRKQG